MYIYVYVYIYSVCVHVNVCGVVYTCVCRYACLSIWTQRPKVKVLIHCKHFLIFKKFLVWCVLVACTWLSAVWPWTCMQRPEEGTLSSFSLCLIPLRHGRWARSLPFQPGWLNRERPWCPHLCSPNTTVTGIWSHTALYMDVTGLNAVPTLAQHSTHTPPHHRSKPATLFSQTGSVTDCGTLQPGSCWEAAPRLLLPLYHITLWSALGWQRQHPAFVW